MGTLVYITGSTLYLALSGRSSALCYYALPGTYFAFARCRLWDTPAGSFQYLRYDRQLFLCGLSAAVRDARTVTRERHDMDAGTASPGRDDICCRVLYHAGGGNTLLDDGRVYPVTVT